MKKILSFLLVTALLLSACSALAAEKVGVAMPTNSLQRWNQDGANMKAQLEAAGYEVDLQYANNDVATQVSQIENMILNGAKVLVIASIDGSALGTVLQTAKDNDIKVIAYDRMLTDTPNVDYYATFDNYKVGTIQGLFLEEKLDLKNAEGPFNFELFAGSPDCPALRGELLGYRWTPDGQGGSLPRPQGEDHLIDALRYAMERDSQGQQARVISR